MPDPTAALFFDADRLSCVVGEPVVARRLRHKPGLSTVAALHRRDDDGGPGEIWGWAQVASRTHDAKITKALRRAGRDGRSVKTEEVDGMTCAFGPVESDPELVKAFREVPPEADAELLRYNPQRRAVVRTTLEGRTVSRRYHSAPGDARAAAHRTRRLQAAGIATIAPISRTKYTSTWPFVGDSDLASLPDGDRPAAARRAGAALARLHAVAPTTDIRLDPSDSMLAGARDLEELDGDLGRRARWLIEQVHLDEDDLVAAHGDFSADQVATGGDEVWLLDLDRHGLAPRGFDFGSFHAVELLEHDEPVTEALLSGYAGVGMDEIRPWVFVGLALRMAEPFRDADPAWRDLVGARLDQMEQWLR